MCAACYQDVHLELLRKKIVSLEERISNKSEVERAKDEESVRSRKLMKLAEKYKRELNEAHVELRDLRARCLTVSEIQVSLFFSLLSLYSKTNELVGQSVGWDQSIDG